ncbi:MAG: hypothetical protein L0Y72_24450 [Gemmataceae bacterium]|nr:hypothetical protein [Gemmataceae bacterium]MCI0742197.1 hypothetical protein [Gemmataceae bacterium]
MNQGQLCRAVARATGESVDFIRRMGFVLVPDHSPPPPPRHRHRARRRWQHRFRKQVAEPALAA